VSFDWNSLGENPVDDTYEKRKATKQFRWFVYMDGRRELQQFFKVWHYQKSYGYREDYLIRTYEEWIAVPEEFEEIPF
jgi:hypothetical protein